MHIVLHANLFTSGITFEGFDWMIPLNGSVVNLLVNEFEPNELEQRSTRDCSTLFMQKVRAKNFFDLLFPIIWSGIVNNSLWHWPGRLILTHPDNRNKRIFWKKSRWKTVNGSLVAINWIQLVCWLVVWNLDRRRWQGQLRRWYGQKQRQRHGQRQKQR